MPTYTYKCRICGRVFDELRSQGNRNLAIPCPDCGAEGIRQVNSVAGLVFKGPGFYATDYGKGK